MLLAKKETKLIKLVKRTLGIIRKARVPFRSSKFSNHIYNNHVHLVLLVLKVLSDMSYQRFMEWIENFDGLWVVLGVDRVPHFTTIHKFAGRLGRRYLDILVTVSSINGRNRVLVTGIDSTGFELTNASYYYITVLERRRPTGKVGRPRKLRAVHRHLKATFVTETRDQMIIAIRLRRGPDNDNKDFIPSYKKLSDLDDRPLRVVVADKGYDCEANHEYIRDELRAMSIIPPRKNRSSDYRTTGRYRREMREGYSKRLYGQRAKSETVNSVIKRKMGDDVRACKCRYQNREIYFKAIAYNVERGLVIIIIIGFLGSPGWPAPCPHLTGRRLSSCGAFL